MSEKIMIKIKRINEFCLWNYLNKSEYKNYIDCWIKYNSADYILDDLFCLSNDEYLLVKNSWSAPRSCDYTGTVLMFIKN